VITFGSNLTVVYGDWSSLKAIVGSKFLFLQYVESATDYAIFAFDGGVLAYSTRLYKGAVPNNLLPESGDPVDQATNDTDKTDFETSYKSKGNKAIVSRDSEGQLLEASQPRTGSELIVVSHNFCDPTTWYETSARVTAQAMTDSGDGLTWTSPHASWIDMTHGRTFDEDAYASEVGHGYAVVVTSDGVTKTQRAPYATSGGDFTVDYTLGKVTFFASQAGKTVLATYSKMVNSRFTLIPDSGKRIDVEGAEVQFSKNVNFMDFVEFEVWVYNPADLPNKVCIEKTAYKRMSNFIDEALGCFPVIPAIGGTAQGTQNDIFGLPFRYGTMRTLRASQGVELRVRLKNDVPFGGEHATATFYCTVRTE
jgi:hypothetical protein